MNSFGEKVIDFYTHLNLNTELPEGVDLLDPYLIPETRRVLDSFYTRYYSDVNPRYALLGINPGRFGAGVTGITFTDPVRLEEVCGIPNSFEKRSELSSRFVYEVIQAYGGAEKFFGRYYLSAVCPLGFVRSGKNLNYYDEKALENSLRDFILSTLHRQLEMGVTGDLAFCLGEGKNYNFLRKLNSEAGLFKEIVALPHPRWVMQYRYRGKEEFIQAYLEALRRERDSNPRIT